MTSRSKCPIKKDLRTPKYRKRVVPDKKAQSKRQLPVVDYNGYETETGQWQTIQSKSTLDD